MLETTREKINDNFFFLGLKAGKLLKSINILVTTVVF